MGVIELSFNISLVVFKNMLTEDSLNEHILNINQFNVLIFCCFFICKLINSFTGYIFDFVNNKVMKIDILFTSQYVKTSFLSSGFPAFCFCTLYSSISFETLHFLTHIVLPLHTSCIVKVKKTKEN